MLGLRHEFLLCWGVILSRIKEYRSLRGGPFLFAFVRACVCCMGIELGEGVISEIRLTP